MKTITIETIDDTKEKLSLDKFMEIIKGVNDAKEELHKEQKRAEERYIKDNREFVPGEEVIYNGKKAIIDDFMVVSVWTGGVQYYVRLITKKGVPSKNRQSVYRSDTLEKLK